MQLSELTDRDAVLAAIREFDQLGREAFLAKYRFGSARSYLLIHDGKAYDSKAIAGVAFGIQFPKRGTLQASEFSGGRHTVQRVLESLGFIVTERVNGQWGDRVWALCANPSRYHIQDALRHLDLDRWSVPRGDVQAGDRVLIWQTTDSEGRRGVVGVGQVLSNPTQMQDLENPFWIDPSEGTDVQRRVEVRYLPAAGLPRWTNDPEAGDIINDLSVARARGGTVFKVTPEQWEALEPFLQINPPSVEELEAEEGVRYRTSPRKGQGFGLSSDDRRVVENYAMEKATEYLESLWTKVLDVSANCSFDLHCQRDGAELRVEVKGTTTRGEGVVLTRNEVEESRRPGYALFLVSEITLDRNELGKAVPRGGICRYFPSWTASDEDLTPISYRCGLDLSDAQVVS